MDLLQRLKNCADSKHPYGKGGAHKIFREAVYALEGSVPKRVIANLFVQLGQRGWDLKTLEHLRICLLSAGYEIDRRSRKSQD